MNMAKLFAGWFDKLNKEKEAEHDYIGEIKKTYFYRLTNISKEDINLLWKNNYPNTIKKGKTEGYRGVSLLSFSWQDPTGKVLEGKVFLSELFNRNLISFEALEIEEFTNYIISNRTARQIRIENGTQQNDPIIIPPFGTRLVNSEILRWYDFLDLRDQDLIQIERTDQAYKFRDWIKLAPFTDRLKKLFARDIDAIGTIRDDYYYRVNNKTEEDIDLPFPLSRDGSANKPYILPKSSDPLKMKVLGGTILNAVGKKKILDLVNSNLVNFQPLDIKVDTNYIISNRTERRIGIMNYNKKDQLVIPPLGTRLINSDKLKHYDFLDWYWQDLIQIEPEDQAFISAANLSRIWGWIKLLPGIVLVGLAGFGIPLWIVYYFGGGADLLRSFSATMSEETALNILGRVFQLGFICIASILPALFYYLFGRQQVEKLREKFFRDVLVLDPHLFSLSEAEAKYDTLLSSAFGSGSSTSPFAILLLIFSTALLVTGWTITITPYGPMPEAVSSEAKSLITFFQINPKPLTLGFLGVYFFSINMIFRRYVRADLTPKTYAAIIVRLLVSLVLVFTIGAIGVLGNPDPANNTFNYTALAVAFIIGVFPEDGFRVIRDTARKVIPGLKGGSDEKYPITDLEGMNQYDQARLLEEGIENIENLAHHNLIELLAFTRIPTARLVDIFDQAILYLHLGIFGHESKSASSPPKPDPSSPTPDPAITDSDPEKENSGKKLLKFLNSLGVRTATDLMEILKDENIENTTESIKDANKLFDNKFDFSLSRLRTIEATFKDDEWLSFILNWRKESAKKSSFEVTLVTDPNKFYNSGSAAIVGATGAIDLPKGLKIEVVYDGVNVRSGPGIEFIILEKLKAGTIVTGTRLHSLNAWVEFEPGKWCAMTDNLEPSVKVTGSGVLNSRPVSATSGAIQLPSLKLEVTNEFLKIRDTPNTTGREAGKLEKGHKIVGNYLFANTAWIEIDKDKWVALCFEGTQYLKFI